LRDWLALQFTLESIVSSVQSLYVLVSMSMNADIASAHSEYDALTCVHPDRLKL